MTSRSNAGTDDDGAAQKRLGYFVATRTRLLVFQIDVYDPHSHANEISVNLERSSSNSPLRLAARAVCMACAVLPVRCLLARITCRWTRPAADKSNCHNDRYDSQETVTCCSTELAGALADLLAGSLMDIEQYVLLVGQLSARATGHNFTVGIRGFPGCWLPCLELAACRRK